MLHCLFELQENLCHFLKQTCHSVTHSRLKYEIGIYLFQIRLNLNQHQNHLLVGHTVRVFQLRIAMVHTLQRVLDTV